jgi:hypothetical protein
MLRLEAPVTPQFKVVLWPRVMLAGLAEKLLIVGGKMVTVTEAVTLPPALLAVRT